MEKIFYTRQSNFPNSESFVLSVLKTRYQIENTKIVRGDNGKPFLEDKALYFSVSHTNGLIFLAISDENVGFDAESLIRTVEYQPILKRFSQKEREEISSTQDFLRCWTVKESAVKWLGGSLANDMRLLRFENGKLYYRDRDFPVPVSFPTFDKYTLAVCSEQNFESVVPERYDL